MLLRSLRRRAAPATSQTHSHFAPCANVRVVLVFVEQNVLHPRLLAQRGVTPGPDRTTLQTRSARAQDSSRAQETYWHLICLLRRSGGHVAARASALVRGGPLPPLNSAKLCFPHDELANKIEENPPTCEGFAAPVRSKGLTKTKVANPKTIFWGLLHAKKWWPPGGSGGAFSPVKLQPRPRGPRASLSGSVCVSACLRVCVSACLRVCVSAADLCRICSASSTVQDRTHILCGTHDLADNA